MTDPLDLTFHHGAMSVPDLDASIGWWRTVMGFELEKREHLPSVSADVAFVRRGTLRIELFQVPEAAPLPEGRSVPDEDLCTHGNKHVAFGVRDLDSAAEVLRARGADIVFIKRMPTAAVLFLRDNAGNLIELLEAAV